MLRIEVRTFNDQPTPHAIAADFDEMGGSIGRSEGNTLVLPDDKRYISRTQVSISFRAGSYVLHDHGSATPTFVNGAAVGTGNEITLGGTEEIRIGAYVLSVSVLGAGSDVPADPFADLLPPPRAAAMPSPQAPPVAERRPDPFDDPLGGPPQGRGASPQPGMIPHDFDPFADLAPAAPAAPAASSAAPLPPDDLGLMGGTSENVDDVFGLKSKSAWDPLAPEDPFAPEQPPGGPVSSDPLAAFAPELPQPAQGPRAQRDDAPMLSGAFRPPQPRGAPTPAQATPQPPPAPPPSAAPRPPQPNDMVVSWSEQQEGSDTGEIKTVVLPSPKRSPPQPSSERPQARPAPAAPHSAPAPSGVAPVPAAPPAAATAAPRAPSQEQQDALLRAFLTGAGVPDLKIPGGLTPELMALIGELTRETLRGTLDLLLARAITKREVRAQATMIAVKENNPLKFSPTVEAALTHIFAPHGQGFMTPMKAVRDAYNDLRSHQFGVMAGMRAALEGVVARFDPSNLEQRLTHKGMLGSIMPSSRRAKLWEVYEQLYRGISKEAEDDFQKLFGSEFLRAYESQIEKLEQEDAANKR